MNKPEYIIIHHSATDKGNAEVFRKAHMAKGWRDIGYHYVIGNGTYTGDGEIEEGRGNDEVGAHAKGYNDKSIGICLVGNFEKYPPSQAQIKSLVKLLKSLLPEYKIPIADVIGHKEVNNTLCPGIYFDIEKLRKELLEAITDYSGHWAESSIRKAIQAKAMLGYGDSTWQPDTPVTRAELAVILDRLGVI